MRRVNLDSVSLVFSFAKMAAKLRFVSSLFKFPLSGRLAGNRRLVSDLFNKTEVPGWFKLFSTVMPRRGVVDFPLTRQFHVGPTLGKQQQLRFHNQQILASIREEIKVLMQKNQYNFQLRIYPGDLTTGKFVPKSGVSNYPGGLTALQHVILHSTIELVLWLFLMQNTA